MAVIRERMVSRGRRESSRLSIVMVPAVMSTRRRRTERRVDFPLCGLVRVDDERVGVDIPSCSAADANLFSGFDGEGDVS